MKHRVRATSPTLVPDVEGEGGGEMRGCRACLDQKVLWGKSLGACQVLVGESNKVLES
jgi:hypothetical protein